MERACSATRKNGCFRWCVCKEFCECVWACSYLLRSFHCEGSVQTVYRAPLIASCIVPLKIQVPFLTCMVNCAAMLMRRVVTPSGVCAAPSRPCVLLNKLRYYYLPLMYCLHQVLQIPDLDSRVCRHGTCAPPNRCCIFPGRPFCNKAQTFQCTRKVSCALAHAPLKSGRFTGIFVNALRRHHAGSQLAR